VRVPIIDTPSINTSERASFRPQLRNPDQNVEAGLQSLGRGIEQVAAGAEAYVAKADELRRTEALTQYQKDVTAELLGDSSSQGKVDAAFDGREAPTGFLNTKGTEASAKSAELLQRLEKRRQELGATLNDRQRSGFLERSAGAYEGARARIESHVGQQFRAAQVATADAAKQAYLDAVATGGDPVDLERQRADVETSIAALALSPEDAKADVAKLRGDAAVAGIGAALANNDVETAAQQLEARKEALGTRYPQVKHQVDAAMKGREQDVAQGEADRQVAAWADEVRSKDGFVSETELRARAKDVPADKQRFFEHSLDRHVRNEAAKKDDAIKAARDVANRADLDRQQIPGAAFEFLRQYDPDFLLAREARRQAQYDRWLALKNGTPSQRSAAAAQQAADDEGFRYRVQRRVREDPSLTPEQIEVEYAAFMKKKYGRNVAVSQPELERAGAFTVDYRQKLTTKEGAADRATTARVQKAVENAAKLKLDKGKKLDPEAIAEEVGRDLAILQSRVEQNGGKPLEEEQMVEFIRSITEELTLERPGRVYGTNTVQVGRLGQQPVYGPQAPPPAAAPTTPKKRPTATGKNGEKFQLSEDGKSWELIK